MFNGGSPSLADIAAVTGNKNDNCNDGFGGNNGWWILIILFALFGWGRGGWGGNGDNSGNGGGTTVVTVPTPMMGGWGYSCSSGSSGNFGFTDAAIQRGFDNQTVIQKLDGINNGICSLGYDQLNQMNGINTNIMQTGYALQQAINNDTVANMQNTNALSTQMANCCCENRQGQADIKYAMATDTCAITTAINQASQNIMENANANYRQLHDENIQLQMQNYRDQIAQKDSLIQSLNLAQSQANQNQFFDSRIDALYDKLSPCPKPAYWVQNPNCCQTPWGPFGYNGSWNNYNNSCCGQNNNCCG